MNRHYRTAIVEAQSDPLTTVAGLATSGLLDTYVVYEDSQGWWVAGGAAAEIVLGPKTVRFTEGARTETRPWEGDPLAVVQSLLAGVGISGWRAYGWCAFELAYAIAGDAADEEVLVHLIIPETEIKLTPDQTFVRSLDRDALTAVEEALGSTAVLRTTARDVTVRLDATAFDYRIGVDAVVNDIEAGRMQKVVLSRVVPVDDEIDFPASYAAGRRVNTPARSFLLQMGDLKAFGFSPEIVVEVGAQQRVVSQPLAGTRALTGDPETDQALREDLLSDPKELHEHAISVKVAVDELTGTCAPDSVVVEEFMTIKERGSVQHIASRVAGRLNPDGNPWDAFAAVFPAVTASGVPKLAAYEAIRKYEPTSRGMYAGTVMTIGQDGTMDAALVLRSVFSRGGKTWLRAGAGVVANSLSERELEETNEKLACVHRSLIRRA
ncbi:salicylate synthase [Nocardia sp. NRRL S-836]|uniref:salicylate synthase n=1 Tax=Nocardia sp. NRRL S-836 TaxID=1519492 RepID=UPI0006ADC4B0|nr:salicylate synthase [Nocardia sp. NRRL S-836]KOV90054.1 lyase [Nocardia sp. NRRL S-836]